ncbi:hypothetical protein BDA96_02G337900 [Sorghum bicolor]|nr:hypothetical protein BDA96_02G337900 [Sorghum bicolor]
MLICIPPWMRSLMACRAPRLPLLQGGSSCHIKMDLRSGARLEQKFPIDELNSLVFAAISNRSG